MLSNLSIPKLNSIWFQFPIIQLDIQPINLDTLGRLTDGRNEIVLDL